MSVVPKTGERRKQRGACAALLIGVSALLFLAYRMLTPRNLLELSRPVIVVPEWRNFSFAGFVRYHWWLSQDQCLVAIPGKRSGLRKNSELLDLVLYRRSGDVWQRSPILLHDLSGVLMASLLVGPSPDGKWFAWVDGNGLNVASLEGPRRLSYKLVNGAKGPITWSHDSRRLILYPPQLPGTMLEFVLDHPSQPEKKALSLPGDRGWQTAVVLDVTLDGRLIAQKYAQDDTKRYECIELEISPHVSPPRYYSIPVPDIGDSSQSVGPIPLFSPDGGSVCWAAVRADTPPWQKWIKKAFPNTSEYTDLTEIGFLWRKGESSSREIGRYSVGRMEKGQIVDDEIPWINDPLWMPDGHHMSFLWRDSVYSIPVE